MRIIDQISGDFGEAKRKKLSDVSAYIRKQLNREGFKTLGSKSHIVPVFIGDEHLSTQVKEYLLDRGLAVALFFYPAVPRGEAMIRVSLCADIEGEEVEYIIDCFQKARDRFRF